MPEQVQEFISGIIDLTAPAASYQIIPAMPFRFRANALDWEIKVVTACTAGPNNSTGSNGPAFNNLSVAIAQGGFASQAAETRVVVSLIVPVPYVDLSASGLHVNVLVPATATALTGRFIATGALIPL